MDIRLRRTVFRLPNISTGVFMLHGGQAIAIFGFMKREKNPPYNFYSTRSGGGRLLSNDAGHSLFVTGKEFAAFIKGRALKPALKSILAEKGFLKERLDFNDVFRRYRERFLAAWMGPRVHIISVTARCNAVCAYCGAGSPLAAKSSDMSLETAGRTVDFIFKVKTPSLLIEFQGGEPLLNFRAVRRIVELAEPRSKKEGRELHFSIVTNLSLMDEAKLEFLVANRVTVCASLDGPAALHDSARKLQGGSSHALTAKWIRRISAAGKKTPGFESPNAICTVTKLSLKQPKAIVDEFLKLGIRRVQLGPLDPFGLAKARWPELGCSSREFLGFYAEVLDYMLELNSKGIQVYEKGALLFIRQLLTGERPGYQNLDLALRLAYNWDGAVYGSDEARMLSNSGDDFFKLGSVLKDSFTGLLRTPLARSLLLSCFQGLSRAKCARCAFNLCCRVAPAYNYAAQGSFWGDMAVNERCALFTGVFGVILSRMREKRARKIFEKWAAVEF